MMTEIRIKTADVFKPLFAPSEAFEARVMAIAHQLRKQNEQVA